MIRRLLAAAALLIAIGGLPAYAVEPSERLADPALEARARALSQELRCLVCQNQSIDESNADLAHDLRVLLRQRLVAGDTISRSSITSSRGTGCSCCSTRLSSRRHTCCGWPRPCWCWRPAGCCFSGRGAVLRNPRLRP